MAMWLRSHVAVACGGVVAFTVGGWGWLVLWRSRGYSGSWARDVASFGWRVLRLKLLGKRDFL